VPPDTLYDRLENGLCTKMVRFSVFCIPGQFLEKQALNVSKLPVTLAAQYIIVKYTASVALRYFVLLTIVCIGKNMTLKCVLS